MNEQKWTTRFLLISVFFSILVVSINYVVNPFNVFNSNLLEHPAQRNERFMKIQYLDKNHSRYNSYLFGSSRIGTTNPHTIEKYIPGSKFYNFTISSANLYDYLMHLQYMLEKKYPIKNIYLQIDIRNMESYGNNITDYQKRLHPNVTHSSLNKFYLQYLFGYFPLNVKDKILYNLNYKQEEKYDLYTSGMWEKTKKEQAMVNNCKSYVKNEKSFHQKVKRTKSIVKLEQTMLALRKIKSLCIENNITLYVFTTPHNQIMMDSFKIDAYLIFLEALSKETKYYDFSGYNSITQDNCNYYESSHYRPLVSKLIAAKIFNDTSISVPDDFGIYITPDNIQHYLDIKRKNITLREK